jgi:hypothetical protein
LHNKTLLVLYSVLILISNFNFQKLQILKILKIYNMWNCSSKHYFCAYFLNKNSTHSLWISFIENACALQTNIYVTWMWNWKFWKKQSIVKFYSDFVSPVNLCVNFHCFDSKAWKWQHSRERLVLNIILNYETFSWKEDFP